jgi:hypothetical protein
MPDQLLPLPGTLETKREKVENYIVLKKGHFPFGLDYGIYVVYVSFTRDEIFPDYRNPNALVDRGQFPPGSALL